MRNVLCGIPAGVALVLCPADGTVSAQQPLSAWVEETPGGDTNCAFDTPYRFFHSELDGRPDLLIYFQGGGACWEWVSCSGMFDTSVSRGELSGYEGIFNRLNPTNPFRRFGVVFIPYCTGDVHIGDVAARYGDDQSTRPVAHHGYRNVRAVLNWLQDRVDPSRVVVSGASAGSYGALFYAPDVARRFPRSRLVLLGDSGLPLLHNYPEILRNWGAESTLQEIRYAGTPHVETSLSLADAHAEAAASGRVRVAQITSDHDAVQSAFYLISGSTDWREQTYTLLDQIQRLLPDFRSYVVGGVDHGLLRTNRFYTYQSNGVALRDWVTDLINGTPVQDVRCDECAIQ